MVDMLPVLETGKICVWISMRGVRGSWTDVTHFNSDSNGINYGLMLASF